MTHVTCRLTTKNRISSGTLGSAIEYWLPLLFYFWLFRKKTICNPLAHLTWKYTTLTCEAPLFFIWLKVCTVLVFSVLAFSVHAFSSTCVFSAPKWTTVACIILAVADCTEGLITRSTLSPTVYDTRPIRYRRLLRGGICHLKAS